MMLKTVRKHGITLALPTAGSTGLTVAISELTKNTIDQRAAPQQGVLLDQVLPVDRYSNGLFKSCYLVSTPMLGKDQCEVWIVKSNDQPVGVVMEVTAPDGYSGATQLLIVADFNGMVLDTHVTEHHETPGLDDKIKLCLSDWITHSVGKVTHGQGDSHQVVKRDGGDSDQFAGTTIIPWAAINAIKRAGPHAQMLSA